MTPPQLQSTMRVPTSGDYTLDVAGRLMVWAYVRVRSARGLAPLSFTFPAITRVGWGAWCVRARICLLASPLAGKIFAGMATRPTRDDLPFNEVARAKCVAALAANSLVLHDGAKIVHFQPSDIRFGIGRFLSDFAIHSGSLQFTYISSWSTFLS